MLDGNSAAGGLREQCRSRKLQREQIGEVASMAAVKGMVPSAENLFPHSRDAELLQTAVRFREAINEDRFVYMLANQKIDENGSIESNILLNQFE